MADFVVRPMAAGFALAKVHRNAVEASRRLKPAIPLVGAHGILIRDEIELEMDLGRGS